MCYIPCPLFPRELKGLAYGALCPTWFFSSESLLALIYKRRILFLKWFLSPSGPLSTTSSFPPVLHLKPKEQVCILPACALCSPHLPALSQFFGCSSVLLITGAWSPLWLGLIGILQSLNLSVLPNPVIPPPIPVCSFVARIPSWPDSCALLSCITAAASSWSSGPLSFIASCKLVGSKHCPTSESKTPWSYQFKHSSSFIV